MATRRLTKLDDFSLIKNRRSVAGLVARQRFFDRLVGYIRLVPGDIVNSWKEYPFTSDSSLNPFISSTKTYSHALNFGYSVNTTVNDVTFLPVLPNTNNAFAYIGNVGQVDPTNLNGVPSLGTKSDILCGGFLYGAPFDLTLKNLTPGAAYRVTFFHYPWDNPSAPDSSYIQNISEAVTERRLNFVRGVYKIYTIDMQLDKSFIDLKFQNDSHLYALVCERL